MPFPYPISTEWSTLSIECHCCMIGLYSQLRGIRRSFRITSKSRGWLMRYWIRSLRNGWSYRLPCAVCRNGTVSEKRLPVTLKFKRQDKIQGAHLPTTRNISYDRVFRHPFVRSPEIVSIQATASATGTTWILFAQQTNPDSLPKLSSIQCWPVATISDASAGSLTNLAGAIEMQTFWPNVHRIRRPLRSNLCLSVELM